MHRPFPWFLRSVGCLLIGLGWLLAGCGNTTTPSKSTSDVAADTGTDDSAEADTPVVKIPTINVKLDIQPQTGNAPLVSTFKATIEGVDKSEVFVTWDFGDGLDQSFDLGKPEEAGGDQVQHTFNSKGSYSIKVTVTWRKNPKKAHAEATGSVQVKDPASLSVGDIALLSSEVIGAGDDVTLTFAITNDGDEVTVPFDTAVYLSLDDTIDTADVLAYTIHLPGMPSGKDTPAVIEYSADGSPGKQKPLSFQIPPGTADGTYFVFVSVDSGKVVNEINRLDNTGECTTQVEINTKVAAKPDLVISAPDFDDTVSYSPGDALKYNHTVGNTGDGEAKSLKFGVFLSADDKLDLDPSKPLDDPSQVDKMLTQLASSTLQKIEPKATLPLFKSVALPDVPDGDYHLLAKVDLYDTVLETDKGNNIAVSQKILNVKKLTKQGVDLALLDMTVKPKGTYLGGSISVDWHVKSQGSLPTPAFPARIFFCQSKAFSKDTCTVNQKSFTIAALAPGEEKSGSEIVAIGSTTPVQKWFVYLQLDPDYKVAELDESNNVGLYENLIITAQANVDIWPDTIGFHPDSVAAGGQIKVSYTVHNDGTTGSGASMTYYAFSTDQTCSAAAAIAGTDVVVKKASFGGLDGLSELQVTETIPVPVALDHAVSQYYLCVILDAENNIPKDTNKGNNAAASATMVKIGNPLGGCFEDGWDLGGKSNNTAATAAIFPAGKPTFGSCGDDDWWKVNVQKGQSVMVSMQVTPDLWMLPVLADLDIDLVAPDGTTILDSVKIQSSAKKVATLTVATAGDYLIHVYPHVASAKAQYTLTSSIAPPVAGVDLIATGLNVGPAATFPGALVKTKIKLTNLGNKMAAPFSVRYVLSSDTTISPDDQELKVVAQPSLGATQTVELAQTLLLPVVQGGTWFVGAVVDSASKVAEVDETNNTAISNPIQLNTQVSCNTDTFSGNHTVDDAAEVPSATASYPGLNVCPGLEDWFAIDLPKGKAFSVKLNWKYQAGKGLLGLQVLDASKTGVVAGSANAQKTVATIPYLQTGGMYYIHTYVLPETGAAIPYDYSMDITVSEPDPTDVCLADYYEANNSSSSNPELGCGLANLTLCLGDEDWFHLNMKKDESVSLDFNHAGQAFQLKIFSNPNLAPIKTLSGNGKVDFVAPADGSYQMQVSYKSPGTKPSTFAYSLKVDGGKGTDLIATFQSVFPQSVVQGEDLYVTVQLSNECQDPAGAFQYGYYFSDDNTLDAGDKLMSMRPMAGLDGKSKISVDDKAMIPLDAKPGPAYVLVMADAAQQVAESQELNNSAASPIQVIELCLPDVFEPNGAPQIAATLPMGKTVDLSLCPYAMDWLKVDLQAGETLTVTALFDQLKGDLDLRLYKVAKFAVPVAVSATKKAPEQIIYTADETTKYYLRINGFAGDANAYALQACKKFGGSCVECKTDADCAVGLSCDATTTTCGPKKCDPANPALCADGNSCTVDVCNASLVCSHAAAAGTPCDDGNACTQAESCANDASCVAPQQTNVLAVPADVTATNLGEAVTGTDDGGFVVAGTRAQGSGALQGHLARYDAKGQLLWDKLYSEGEAPCGLEGVVILPGSGELVAVGTAGLPAMSGATGGWYLRVSLSDGGVIASKLIGTGAQSTRLHAVVALDAQWVIAAGSAADTVTSANGQEGLLARLDGDGNVLWNVLGGGAGNDALYGLTRLATGDVVAVGADEVPSAATQGLYLQVQADGTLVHKVSISNGAGHTIFYAVMTTASGILVGGATDADQPGMVPPAWQSFLASISPSATVAWSVTVPASAPQATGFAGTKTSAIYALAAGTDGGFAAAGTTGGLSEPTGQMDAALWTFDATANLLSTNSNGKAARDTLRGLIAWRDGWLGYGSLAEGDATSTALQLWVLPPAPVCQDGNPCTIDACAADIGCTFTPASDGTPCGSGLTCTAGLCL